MNNSERPRVQLQVRAAKLEDEPALFAMHRALHITHRDSHLSQAVLQASAYRDFETVLRQDLRHLLRDRNSFVFVASEGSTPAGYVSGKVHDEPGRLLPRRGFMEDWWVEPAYRGMGLGRTLALRLRDAFLTAGCQVFESSTWASNEGARNAHRRLGFSEAQVTYRLILGDEDEV